MKRIKLIVAYDGTHYHGWQIQHNAHTIEAELNQAISQLFQTQIKVVGASRTDTGVHAYGNVAIFDVEIEWEISKIAYALNQILPEDIRIQKSEEVDKEWHPRYCKSRKTYEYHIWSSKIAMPTKRYYSYQVKKTLNIEKMKKACQYFIGEYDFKSFRASKSDVEHTIRTIYSCEIYENQEEIIIEVCGNGFLYNMVRIMVGTILKVGEGEIQPEEIKDIIQAKDRKRAGKTVPPQGLFLKTYEFE